MKNQYPFPVPLTLKCTVTGKEVTYTAAEYIKGRIEKAGSLELLRSTYVSKGANKPKDGAPAAKSTRSWKGEEVIKKTSTAPEQKVEEGPRIHNIFKLDDDVECNVYVPQSNPDQLPTQTFDFRKKKVA
jgi:hypothetical protein